MTNVNNNSSGSANKTDNAFTNERLHLKILSSFAVELISITNETDLAWHVAREVVGKLGFVDCVVYFIDPERNLLRQAAAIGAKNPVGQQILNPLEIAIGEGVTGKVAQTRQALIVDNLSKFDGYIPDLEQAQSEICVPLISADRIFGVIDCEDPRPGHFGPEQLDLLTSVAALMTAKLEFFHNNQALQASESRNSMIFSSALDGIITINAEGNIIECNPAAEKMFGFKSDDICGKALADTIIPPEFRDGHITGLQKYVETGKGNIAEQRLEVTAIRTNGENFPVELTVTPYIIDEELFFTGFLRDITERKQAEKAERNLERQFGAFIDHFPSAILIKNSSGHYLHANKRWHEWFNPEGVDIAGKTVFDFFPEDHANIVDKHDKLAIAQAPLYDQEIQTPLADGTIITTLLQKFPILDEDENVVAIGGVNTDISMQKKMEEDLRQALIKAEEANHSKSEFLATMSHELRTPLNAIIGFSDILRNQYFGALGNEKYLEYANDIQTSGQHLLGLISEVLDISAIELGRRELVFKTVAIDKILDDCFRSVKHSAQISEIHLSKTVSPNIPEIYGDERAIKQIFLNLLANAIKFSGPGDTVTLSAAIEGQEIAITVTDTGEGIDAELMPLLTNPFVRGQNDAHTAREGVGLGLSIVKSLIEAHFGQLKIESELGKGTTVTVKFQTRQTVNQLTALASIPR